MSHDPEPGDLTPAQLSDWMSAGGAPVLVDVREPWEWAIARLPGARLVPLATLPASLETLDPEAELVVYCHHGMRSASAVAWLHQRGFPRARNLDGGIEAWSVEVDPTVPRY